MKKISIIIPNYNGGRFIKDCLDSVVNQSYPNKEVIIIDDGSTDNSVEIIQNYIMVHKKDRITVFLQDNLNAAIARNKGLEAATGDYVLFLDSDDLLEEDILEYLAEKIDNSSTDLIIGNYREIDEKNKLIGDKRFVDNDTILAVKENFERLIDIRPVPSNKLYSLKVIKRNNLLWGNVKIGQDLDFYYKYLLLCKKVYLVNKHIYRYRINSKSMSHTYDFRIFDIVNVFSDIESFYNRHRESSLYATYIPFRALKHYGYQMSKQVNYGDRRVRDMIVRFFCLNERRLDYSLSKNSVGLKKERLKFRIKCFMRPVFTSGLYRKYKLAKVKNE